MTTYTVNSGETWAGLTLNSGDELDILSGGINSGTIVNSGGKVFVAGGIASDTIVNNGGYQQFPI